MGGGSDHKVRSFYLYNASSDSSIDIDHYYAAFQCVVITSLGLVIAYTINFNMRSIVTLDSPLNINICLRILSVK